MKIIYPALVEQSYKFMKQQGIEAEKADIYKMMVRDGVLTQTGEPTENALKQGLVTAFNQKHKTLKEFKSEYSIFKNYGENQFTQQDGIWYISQLILEKTHIKLINGIYDYDEELQVKTYFNFRNYENPYSSISEMKGAFHPWYTPYDDSMFSIVGGEVSMSKSIIEDMAYRSEKGELDIDSEKLNQLLIAMEEREC